MGQQEKQGRNKTWGRMNQVSNFVLFQDNIVNIFFMYLFKKEVDQHRKKKEGVDPLVPPCGPKHEHASVPNLQSLSTK